MNNTPKPKPCKVCGDLTTRRPMLCGFTCSMILLREKQAKKKAKLAKDATKEFNAETRRRKEKLKTKRDYIKDLQVLFNRFIRMRDQKQPCISCNFVTNDDDLVRGSRWDAGHYRSIGSSPELRFNEDNCHKQCVKCNRSLSGNVANYRINLFDRIGPERLEQLDRKNHPPLKLTIDEIKAEIVRYRSKIKLLNNTELD